MQNTDANPTSFVDESNIPDVYTTKIEDDGFPVRVLDNFFICTKNETKLVPLENIGNYLIDVNPLIAVGNINKVNQDAPENPKSISIQSSPITRWCFEFSEEQAKIWIQTEKSWYILASPTTDYEPHFTPLKFKGILCDKIIDLLEKNEKITLKEAAEEGYFDLHQVLENWEFIRTHVLGTEGDAWENSPFFMQMDIAHEKYLEKKKQEEIAKRRQEELERRELRQRQAWEKENRGVLEYFAKHWEVIEPFITENENVRDKTRTPHYKIKQIYEEMKKNGELNKPEEKPKLMKQPSFIVNVTMRDYQLEGLQWMLSLYDKKVTGCILGDEMGLGKTLQTVALLASVKYSRKAKGQFLVIAPLSVLPGWIKEFNKCCPSLRVLKYHGNQMERVELRSKLRSGKYDVVVTNYESIKSDYHHLNKTIWTYVVLDEAHRIKNEKAQISKKIFTLRRRFCLLLTGTPLQNNLHELWALLYFMYPEIFNSSEKFDNCFDLTNKVIDKELLAKANLLLKPFMKRRLKSEVELGLPEKIETKLYVPLSEMQTNFYKNVLTKTPIFQNGKKIEMRKLMMLLMQLRKVCCHPFLFEDAEEVDSDGEYVTDERIITASGKMVLLDKLLPKIKKQGSKVLLYSQFTTMLDILEDYCNYRGYNYVRLDGSTHQIERESNVDRFNHKKSDVFIFLLSTRAGGLGLNLVAADTVILYDSDWNPQIDRQAFDRAHRIGQNKTVNIYRLVCQGTVEERILNRAEQKMFLDAMVMQTGDLTQTMSTKDVMSIIAFGAKAIFQSSGTDITEDDIDLILRRSRDYDEKTKERMKEFNSGEYRLDEFEIVKDQSTYVFNGVDHEEERKRRLRTSSAEKWKADGKREKKNRVVKIKGLPVLKATLEDEKIAKKCNGTNTSKKRKRYEHDKECSICGSGKDKLISCTLCPKSYHLHCLGLKKLPRFWKCPWHYCVHCKQSNQEAGGMMYRCVGPKCTTSFCRKCAPDVSKINIIGRCFELEQRGYKCRNAIYVYCSSCSAKNKDKKQEDEIEESESKRIKTE